MTLIGWAQIALVLSLVFLCAVPLGGYIARVVQGERTFLSPMLGPIERGFYAVAGVNASRGMGWLTYATALIVLQAVHFLILFLMLRFQDKLPFNPQGQSAVSTQLAFNTAISFVTNTNWQAYGGETTLSYGSQMWGLTVHNFLSAATGIAAAVAVARAFVAGGVKELGNFWVDLTRITLYLLLPIVLVYTVFLIASGVPQTMAGYVDATTLEGAKQTIALGPVAFQEAIKMLGTNGGGFFNANSAHPFENPTALTNVVETWSEIVIPFSLAVMFGHIVRDKRQGFALMWVMAILMVAAIIGCYAAEGGGNPLLTVAGIDPSMGNMEGKEVRFGTAVSSMFAVTTTATSDGAVIAMHDSFTPLGGMVPMFLIQLGEVVPGGVGSGLYGILVFALLAVFVAGLMVGRTPEYLGKKVHPGRHRALPRAAGRRVVAVERRAAWVERDAVCVQLGDRQQRQRVRRADGGHAAAGLRAGRLHAAGAVRLPGAGAGDCRVARGQAEAAGERGDLPDARAAVHRPADRRDPDPGRIAVPACAVARAARGALLDARRQDLLRTFYCGTER